MQINRSCLDDSQPAVLRLPHSVTVSVGDAASFELELASVENLAVQWFKGVDKVEKSDRVKSVKSGNTFKLDFKVIKALQCYDCN